VLTRRIGLELIVPQYPALARDPAPSEQGTKHDETGAGPLSTCWEQPVENGPPPAGERVLVRFAGSGPASPRGVLQHGKHLGRCGLSSPSRGRVRSGPRGQTAGASGPGGRGGLENGAQAPGSAGLSSRRIHELATEGARATRIGVSTSHHRDLHRSTSLLVACAARADLALTRGHPAGVTTARSRSRRW
jgi:hypothetical protein